MGVHDGIDLIDAHLFCLLPYPSQFCTVNINLEEASFFVLERSSVFVSFWRT